MKKLMAILALTALIVTSVTAQPAAAAAPAATPAPTAVPSPKPSESLRFYSSQPDKEMAEFITTTVMKPDILGPMYKGILFNTEYKDVKELQVGDPIAVYPEKKRYYIPLSYEGKIVLMVIVSDIRDLNRTGYPFSFQAGQYFSGKLEKLDKNQIYKLYSDKTGLYAISDKQTVQLEAYQSPVIPAYDSIMTVTLDEAIKLTDNGKDIPQLKQYFDGLERDIAYFKLNRDNVRVPKYILEGGPIATPAPAPTMPSPEEIQRLTKEYEAQLDKLRNEITVITPPLPLGDIKDEIIADLKNVKQTVDLSKIPDMMTSRPY